ncbi:hypothetical protein FGG08_004588 [Glutinoglossum americanum]|uniref:BHLH domain-containing protein n=1 Tax=Glutinoglossum americanum TaxID=1670608 RepID=A0A9P8I0B5_9PEZI|nr:hypothetical protein FGG08_004588 [Glutinoglossum americanum]
MAQPWDSSKRASAHSVSGMSQQQQLPSISNITNGVPGPIATTSGEPSPKQTPNGQNGAVRDSGNWSMQSPSSHSSVISMASNPIQLPPLEPTRTSPNRNSLGPNDPSTYPSTYSSAPQSTSLQQQSPVFAFGYGASDASQPRPNGEVPHPDSRRSSFDARLGNLNLSSPLGSNNASQVSLTSTLQSKRGIPVDGSRGPNGLASGRRPFSPFSQGSSNGGSVVPGRTAPPINPSNRFPFPHPNAPSPTKGFPYAFPDPEVAATQTPSNRSIDRSTISGNSRNGSIGGNSLANSAFTNRSSTPPGQRRMHDCPPGADLEGHGALNGASEHGQQDDFSRPASLYGSRSSTDLTGVNQHHHHQLQHKQLTGLIGEPGSPNGSITTPYSRTPELRVSHKLAERKRRKEMKDLFDELRDILPHERGGRSSKWEVLTQAVEYIHSLKTYQNHMQRELDVCRRDGQNTHLLQQEVNSLRMQMQAMQTQQQQQQHPPSFQANGPPQGQGHSHQPVTLPPPSMMEY